MEQRRYLIHEEQNEQLEIPNFNGPTINFVINGIRLSLEQNLMTKDEAISKIKSWYPEATIDIEAGLDEAIS